MAIQPTPPEYVTAPALKGDLVQTVEAVGTIVSERDIELRFPTSGVVANVLVKEGDKVKAGQRLAQLRAGSLSASVASAAAILQSEEARLRAMMAGSRPEDIAIAEAELESKKASLQVAKETLETAERTLKNSQQQLQILRDEAEVSLVSDVDESRTAISQKLTVALTSLGSLQDLFSNLVVSDAISKHNASADDDIIRASSTVESSIRSVMTKSATANDFESVLAQLEAARQAGNQASNLIQQAYDLISTIPLTNDFTASVRETHKATLSAEKNNILSAVASLDSSLSTLRNASASYDTRIVAEEAAYDNAIGTRDKTKADIVTYESAVRISEAQLSLQRAGSRQEDIDAQAARVRQARADVARASANLGDTVITAPLDGTITQVHVKNGEYTPSGPSITMLGVSPYRIEMFVSEIDIPKVQMTQSGSIELDAFPGVNYALKVTDIDPAATLKDGVSKYRIKLDFVHPHEELKIGMTGDAEVITGERKDVVSVPRRAVIEDDEGRDIVRVLHDDGEVEERQVVTGIEGSTGDIEVISGIQEGEVVIVLEKN